MEGPASFWYYKMRIDALDKTRQCLDETLANIELNPDLSDLDSEWWIKTIKDVRENKGITVTFDDEQ
ncbi:MAG: hypothetical protein JNN15_09210 [Blastocatellia bacterium]|nr:hypothetical protein [Blastocatellia bacterium]